MQNATWLFIAVISIRQTSEIRSRLIIGSGSVRPENNIYNYT